MQMTGRRNSAIVQKVKIRLYAQAKGYDHHMELKIALESNGDVSIKRIQQELQEDRLTCRVGRRAHLKGSELTTL
jgi:hypothetical protein